jgi:hypothetical protein
MLEMNGQHLTSGGIYLISTPAHSTRSTETTNCAMRSAVVAGVAAARTWASLFTLRILATDAAMGVVQIQIGPVEFLEIGSATYISEPHMGTLEITIMEIYCKFEMHDSSALACDTKCNRDRCPRNHMIISRNGHQNVAFAIKPDP